MLRSSTLYRSFLLAGLTAVILSACGGGDSGTGSGNPPPGPPPPAQRGTPTAVGNAAGTATSQTIGAAGGQLVLEEGRIMLDVPAGALAQDTLITAQPITNHAHGGAGQAYRFGPEGVRFEQPVTLTFRYGEGDVEGSAPEALGVAFQRPGGVWEWAKAPVLDSAARQVSITTSHFSDWSLVRGMQLLPSKAVVPVGKTQGVRVLYCYSGFDESDLLTPLGDTCGGDTPAGWEEASAVKEWAVNGQQGGNAVVGTIAGGQRGGATYTAPADPPNPAEVTVSARADLRGGGQILLLSNITVDGGGDYTGTVEFSTKEYSGTARMSWKLVEDDGFVRTYRPSGTMDLDINFKGCDPARRSISIENAYMGGDLRSVMYLFTERAVEFPKSHAFVLWGKEPVTLQCGTPRAPFEVMGSTFLVQTAACNGAGIYSYTDGAVLSGQYNCPAAGVNSVTWRFQSGTP